MDLLVEPNPPSLRRDQSCDEIEFVFNSRFSRRRSPLELKKEKKRHAVEKSAETLASVAPVCKWTSTAKTPILLNFFSVSRPAVARPCIVRSSMPSAPT
jgi:hypothetical protein